jgi:hypothetical protein
MNTDKYKSVAVPAHVWEMVQEMARINERSMAGQVAWLIRQEHKRTNKGSVKDGRTNKGSVKEGTTS